MIHRLALIVGGIAAAAILALGFAAASFGSAGAPVDAAQGPVPEAATVPTSDPPAAKPITRVQTTTVYVRAAPKPKVVHITRRDPAPTRQQPITKRTKVIRVRKSTGGEHEGDHERGDD